jgi:hypothetical protein
MPKVDRPKDEEGDDGLGRHERRNHPGPKIEKKSGGPGGSWVKHDKTGKIIDPKKKS